ncbi:LANO_0D00298g1_1 [Lachancea nothofagi CBS 11611]|uniref:LANO_0D00298g1_1 n=1 Tax=Lachancea nothofagi CBS 11611 TaxID=1266666 RepID=A0A1G4JCK3_9SACH|nr:LANO_0D00298g1_1 [Lachancea nothofagi CBS 11611]
MGFATIANKRFHALRLKCQSSNYHVAIGTTLIFLGCTFDLMNVAGVISTMNDLHTTYNISYTEASWALTSYAITFTGFIAFMGRLGDIVGNSILFTISCFAFTITSLLCAVVPNFPTFTVFRALQGISAAGIVPCGYALIPVLAKPEEVQKFFSIVSCGFSSTIGLGLIIGGAFVLTKVGYAGIFYLTFAAMFVVGVLSLFFLYRIEEQKNTEVEEKERPPISSRIATLDFIGSSIFVIGSVLIVVGLTEGGESWKKPKAFVPFMIGIILFCGFFVWNCAYQQLAKYLSKSRYNVPSYFYKVHVLVPTNVLFMTNFIPLIIGFACNNACLFATVYIIDQYSQYVDKVSPLVAGVRLVPLMITMTIGNFICSLKSSRLQPRFGVVLGFVLMLSGSIILTQLHRIEKDVYWKIIFISQVLIGGGASIFYPYGLSLAVGNAPKDSKGIASGVTQTFAQLGIELAFSIIISVLGDITEVQSASNSHERFRDAYQKCTYFCIAVSALGLVVTTLFLKRHPTQSDEESLASNAEGSPVDFKEEEN